MATEVEQKTLSFEMPTYPLARRSDEISSHQAAADLVKSGEHARQKAFVLKAVKDHPDRTARELADLTGSDRYMVSRRLPDLLREGLVEKTGCRVCTVGGKQSVIWRAK